MTEITYLGRDRRKFPRLRVRLAVVYQVNKPLTMRMQIGEKEIVASALDLSEGGMAISTNFDLPLQADLLIKFTLFRVSDNDRVSFYGPMEIIGEIRSNTVLENGLHRVGICFTNIDEKDKKEILNFLDTTNST